jgi:AcrR family transcriptional regulator
MNDMTPPARTRKPRGQGPSRRGEILASAKRLFLEHGVEHATMRRIAAEVGVSPTALYVYFPDKLAILNAISESMFESLLEACARAQSQDLPPLQRFRAAMRAYVDLAFTRPDEYRLTFGSTNLGQCQVSQAADASFGMLEASVTALMDAGLFARADPTCVAEALWACLHGVVMLLLNQADHIATDQQRLIDTVIDATMKGFRA